MDKERIQRALDSLVYLPHLKEKALQTVISPVNSKDAGGKGRLWDRGDLFRRLQTYKPATWFCKPDTISPVECARRGWLNTGPDMLSCEFCKAKVSCPIPPQLLPEDSTQMAGRYAKQLIEAHDTSCPWRTNCCAASLLQFPPLTQEAVREDFRKRSASLQRLVCLPPLAQEAYDQIAARHGQALDQLLLEGPGQLPAGRQGHGERQQQQQGRQHPTSSSGGSRSSRSSSDVVAKLSQQVATWNAESYEPRLRLLALCGWDLKVVSVSGGDSNRDTAQALAHIGALEDNLATPSVAAGGAACVTGSSPGAGRSGIDGGGSHVGPECSALACALCGAKAGLWTFFPQCRPQVQAAPPRKGGPSSGPAGAAPGMGGLVGGTTIAGGLLSSPTAPAPTSAPAPASSAAGGPFGASSGALPLFGRPSAQPLAAGSAPRRPARNIAGGSTVEGSARPGAAERDAAAAVNAQLRDGTADQPMPGGPFGAAAAGQTPPVFGLAAHAPGAPAAEPTKRKQPEGDTEEAGAGGEAGTGEKRSRGEGPGGVPSPGATAPLQYCSTEAVQRYRDMEALPLNPLALHRRFCPWVNKGPRQAAGHSGHSVRSSEGNGAAEPQSVRCGWRWCLQQLVPGSDDVGLPPSLAQNASDPAKLLRAVLRRVEVHN
ncbi:hypothetical protein N2152v2_000103 [Parachlorella kessleri]